MSDSRPTPESTKLDRRQFLRNVGAAAAGAALVPAIGRVGAAAEPAGASDVGSGARPPNVLFVLADQWRFSAFSHEADAMVQTPNMDKLAASGARFTRMHAANPVCTPNRSCILTSRFSHQHGMTHNDIMLPPKEKCFPEVFAEAGYATHYIGKWHMDGAPKPGYVAPGWRRRGFKTFEGFNRGHYYPKGAQYFTDDGKLLKPDVFESYYQTDLALKFMKEQKDHPFFCYLSWGPPHTPYRPPPEHERFAKLDKYPWRPNVPEKLRDTPKMLKDMGGYLGLCETLDQEMGRLLKGVEEMGLADNTLVVFTADHGDMHGSHALYFKSKPQEESLHIPLFMRMPGKIQANHKLATLASSIDLGPTMMSLCGLKVPQTVTGRDLSGAVLGKTMNVDSVYAGGAMRASSAKENKAPRGKAKAKAQDAAAKIKAKPGGEPDGGEEDDSTPGGEWRALVTPTHKLIRHVNGGVHLYDLEHDPYEMKDLAADRQSEALKTHLMEEMKRWAKETGDPYPEVSNAAKVSYTDDEAKAARGG